MSVTESKLKCLYAKRDSLFSRMQAIADSVKDLESKSFDPNIFLCNFENINSCRDSFEKVLDDIAILELKNNPAYIVSYQSLTEFDRLMGSVLRAAKRLEAQSQLSSSIAITSHQRLPKLPPVEIPEFNGELKNWPLFIASFRNAIHNNPSLADSEKLYYLIGRLTGKARSICAGISLTAENYSLIFDLLNNKYEDKRLLATSYLDQIFEFKPISSGNPANLELFLDRFATSVAAIKNLKVDDLSDLIFLHIALRKLDRDTAHSFESNHLCTQPYSEQNKGEIPSFKNLVSFLREHIKILERTSSSKVVNKQPLINRKLSPIHAFASSADSPVCSLCSNQHDYIYKCNIFNRYNPNERFQFVKANNLCINCLRSGHRVSACNSASLCKRCNNRHHTLLCFGKESITARSNMSAARSRHSAADGPPRPVVEVGKTGSACNENVALCSSSDSRMQSACGPTTVLIATARVIVMDSRGKKHNVRALLDSASQSNFITSECSRRLGFKINNRTACRIVKGIGGSSKTIQGSLKIKFHSRFDLKINYDIESLVVDTITDCLPTATVDNSLLSSFKNLPLADDTYYSSGPIDMLLGGSVFPHLLMSNKVQGQSPYNSLFALETVLGYVIVGDAPVRLDSSETVSYCCTADPLDSAIRKFWELEELQCPPVLSTDDKLCEEYYVRTTYRDNDGRYVVALPFKGDIHALGDSRQASERRFYCLERKMQASPQLKAAYDSVIREYLDKGYISSVQSNSSDISYFIPHFPVIREDKATTKLRVVLDGSCKTTTSVSLNDLLYQGQNLQGNLFNIITNFRLFSIALSADVRQMFLSIGVRESDRRFLRILYRFAPQEALQVFNFNRVVFGLRPSPFHALRTIRQLAADEGAFYPHAKDIIETGFYMDDFVYSVPTEDLGISTASDMIGLMKAGHFELIKWVSNSQRVLDSIPPSHRLPIKLKEFDKSDQHKVLGLCWCPTSDLFQIKIGTPTQTCTKRTILSCVAKIWDVMGFVAPVVLYAKLLIKQLWLCDCDWDDTPPDEIVKSWDRFKKELPLLSNIKIPRHVGIVADSVVTILAFADASEKAYGGVLYFHVQNNNSNKVYLITAKSKVSPKKIVSLARLELCAILVLAQLIKNIVVTCQNRITFRNIFAFSDSTVALCWVHSSPHRWNTFVANRVTKIQDNLPPQHWFFISGSGNPADCLSRGLTPSQIMNHPLWFSGPPWAHLDVSQWPAVPFNLSSEHNAPEEKKLSLLTAMSNDRSPILALGDRISSWTKLIRSVIFVCRFLKLLPPRYRMAASDYDYAELIIFRELQKFHFSIEIARLKKGKICSPSFRHLKPFLEDGLIRVGGRLRNSDLNYDGKYPILLPSKDHILNLLVEYHHKLNCHAGPDLLMSLLRQKFWILSARNLIRNRIHKCMSCFRLRPKPTFPEMADHRSYRVVQSVKPFVHTGTDYAGPFKVTISRGRGIRSTKAYVCLFVCMTTRAVHIELAGDLSTASFMNAFKRFLSRRGPVSKIYSDNGTNYIGAKRKLSELHEFLCSKYHNTEFGHMLAENRIDWCLNVPAASHFGGNWETNVRSFKQNLYRVIGDTILSFEELSTILAQVESVLNTRPLCRTLSSDPAEPLALTPAHFLNLTPLKFLPAGEIDENLTIVKRHELLDKIVQSFWKRWRNEYLHTLQSRRKWNTPVDPVTVGSVVILVTDNSPPLHWPLAVVEEVYPDATGITRIARIRTATGSYLRPVVRLCPLPNQ